MREAHMPDFGAPGGMKLSFCEMHVFANDLH